MSDYNIPFNELSAYIPPQLQNTVNVSLMKNLFDKLITHDESVKFYGVIGDKGTPNLQGRPYLSESTTDRYFNSLSPAFYYKIGNEEVVFTLKDLLNKAQTMGIDVSQFATWGQVGSFNYVPPIDLDKFVNFSQYYWIQQALPLQANVWNPNSLPEYYVIARPKLTDEVKMPVNLATTGPIYLNGTLEPEDIWTLTFTTHTDFTVVGSVSGLQLTSSIAGATALYPGTTNVFSSFTVPGFFTFNLVQRNIAFVAGDMFTITLYPLSNSPTTIVYSGTGNGYVADARSTLSFGAIDGVNLQIGMRVLVKNQVNIIDNGIYIVSAENWSRALDDISHERVYVNGGNTNIGTWELLNGVATWLINTPNINAWASSNFWIHQDDLESYGLSTASNISQALRPILEYDNDIEMVSFIDNFTKIKFNQAPLFSLYDYNSSAILVNNLSLCSAIFYYKEDLGAAIDQYLQRRVVTQNFNFVFEHGLSFNGRSVFFKKSGQLATIWRQDTNTVHSPLYATIGSQGEAVPYVGDPSTDLTGVGDWLTPFQMTKNPEFETKPDVAYGDFYSHLTSIIAAQPGLTGSSFSNNNYRNLTPDLGVGGTINLASNQFNLFVGLLNQTNLTPITLIDFAEQQYKNGLSSLIDFIDLNLGSLLMKYAYTPSTFAQNIFADYKTFYANKIELQNVFTGQLGPIPNWPLTLPMLGVLQPVLPSRSYNPILFTQVLIHHDGHQSSPYLRDISVEQLLTSMLVDQPNGTKKTGTFGPSAPSSPYQGQLWFDSVNQVLKTYNLGTNQWLTFSISDLYNDLTLIAETELYNFSVVSRGGQPIVWDITNPAYAAEKYLAPELSKFAIANGLDPYGSNYIPADPYTWNYGSCTILQTYGIPTGVPRWNSIYQIYLGTSRPDLEPWVILNLTSANLATALGVSENTMLSWLNTPASSAIWTYVLANTSKKICVDPTTGIILPPYVSHTLPQSAYALITNYSDIISPNNYYSFGQGGLVETVWRNTVDFRYGLFRASMKADPINCLTATWGFQTFTVGGLNYDKITKNILTHKAFSLHSEARVAPPADSFSNGVITSLIDTNSYTFDLTVTSNSNNQVILSNFYQGITVQAGIIVSHCIPNFAHPFDITISEGSNPLLLGDIVRITQTVDSTTSTFSMTAQYIPSPIYVYNGLNQLYVNLKLYNGMALTGDYNDYGLRQWTANLIYRTNYLVDTNSLSITTEGEGNIINPTSYEAFLKINSFAKSSWVHALRIQVISIGSYSSLSPTIFVPSTDGSDWVFRIENYFSRYTSLEKYNTNTSGTYVTFNALNSEHTDLEWRNYVDIDPITPKSIVHLPITITGIQNVVTFLNEYIMFVTDDGWAVGQGDQPEIDVQTGRTITWQLEVEKFIDTLYKGVTAGNGIVLNPFLKTVWFNTPQGLVSNFNHNAFDDVSTGQLVYDIVGDIITPSALTVVRQDQQTMISGAVPMFGAHVTVNEYEHIIIFQNYNWASSQQGLLYDQFLGIRINKLLIKGKRQSSLNNRPTYGGFFLNGNTTSKNVAASIDDVANYYYSDAAYDNPVTTPHALALFGFSPKTYFSNLNIDPRSEFNFWRGMVTSKGSNYSFEAFINSVKFETAKIDEFWAYKVAEYGDAREKDFPELRVESTDCLLKHTRLFFSGLEQDTPVDVMTTITNDDENRWFAYSDLNQDLYFSAKTLDPYYISTTTPNQLVELPFLADQILVFDAENIVQVEAYITDFNALATIGQNPDGSFKRAAEMIADINAIEAIVGADADISTKVQIVNNTFLYVMVPGNYTIIGYTPMRPKYSPIQLYDYVSNVFIENISVWHPLYDYHTPEALEVIDIVSSEDPTRYNYSVLTSNNPNYDPSKCWGANDVGTIWWDTTNLDYIPYSDQYIYPSFEERLIRWGSLAEYADIHVYEWVNSSVAPSAYDAAALLEQGDSTIDNNVKKTGTAARKELYKSTRTWQGRAIAWSNTPNPSATEYVETLVFAVDIIYLSAPAVGPVTVVIENGTFTQYGLSTGMSIGGWIVNKPYGELVLTAGTGYFVGTSYDTGSATFYNFPGTSIFSYFSVNLNTTATNTVSVGQVVFAAVQQGTNYYLTATNQLTNVMQSILIVPITDIPGTEIDFNFSNLGFTVSAYVANTSNDFAAIAAEFVDNLDVHVRNFQNGNVVIPFNSTMMDNTLPVISPNVYFDTLSISGLININTITVSRNRNVVGNYTLTTDQAGNLSLFNNGYFVQTIAIPAITSNFSLVFDIFTIAITMTTLTSTANFVTELLALLSSMTVGLNGSLVQFVTQDPNVTTTTYNWRAWTSPTQADLTADTSVPFSVWSPIPGDWIDLPATKSTIDSITAYNKAPLITNSGGAISKFNSVWSDWGRLNDELQHVTSVGTLISFTMSTPIVPSYFSLYINGVNQITSTYTLDPNYPTIVTLNTIVPVGNKVTAYLRKYEPTATELAFDPSTTDIPSTMTKYKYDYEYVVETVRDSSGQITGSTYYFWVENKSIAAVNNPISCQEASILLTSGPSLYMTFQDMRIVPDNGYETIQFFDMTRYEVDSLTNLKMLYKAVTIANLGSFVTKDNTYKLRFTRDFTLRDDPNELDLKNTHTEWTLIRPNAKIVIPEQLWNLVIDSACGQDILGNVLPNPALVDYDNRHGTQTQYGFGQGQIFIEQNLILASLMQAIVNPTTTKWVNGAYVLDTINTIDYTSTATWFSTPQSTRQLLTQIWTTATPAQINGVFFAVLEDALANDYTFTDLFKTSRISAHSITTN